MNGSGKTPVVGLLIAFGLIVVLSIVLITTRDGKMPTQVDETSSSSSASTQEGETSASTQEGETSAPVTDGGDETSAPETSSEESTAEKQTSASETTTKKKAETTAAQSDYEYAYAGFAPSVAVIDEENWNLLLVSKDYILPDDFEVSLDSAIPGSSVRLDERVCKYYTEMYNAAKEDGVTLTPYSGHRRISTQRTNFENKISYFMDQGESKAEATRHAAERILPPGTSEHNAGLAMDICSASSSFLYTDEYAWLVEHAADYGFIERYKAEKQDITGIIPEPWHWRYVGKEAAKVIKAQDICLEEYLEKYA